MMPMTDLPAAATLDVWQEAAGLRPIERTLALAAAAGGGTPDELSRLPLGRRDIWVLSLHEALGGQLLAASAPCPTCGEETEFELDPDTLLGREESATVPVAVKAAGLTVHWRPPSSRDLIAASEARDVLAAERVLLERCVRAEGADGRVNAAALPAEVRDAVSQAMAEADPLAEVLVDLSCSACGGAFTADLDVGSFVWAELQARARRLMKEVDVLARAYGWTETEVLALSERRRAAYLELARGATR
jgi:hypothetical protein